MPTIEPIDRDAAVEQGLGRLLDGYADLGDDDALFVRILARAPGYAEAIGAAMAMVHLEGGLDHRLKEIVRIQLARSAQDPYFSGLRSRRALEEGLTEDRIEAGSADFETDPQFTAAEKWALRYAFWMYRRPERLDADFYAEGKLHFSEAQIMELGGLVALHYGMQVFMRTLDAPGRRDD
jgi:alkylhydroperoxidase family enzyme